MKRSINEIRLNAARTMKREERRREKKEEMEKNVVFEVRAVPVLFEIHGDFCTITPEWRLTFGFMMNADTSLAFDVCIYDDCGRRLRPRIQERTWRDSLLTALILY
jgi:hypothetical protein